VPENIRREATASKEWCCDGLRNIWLMLLILAAPIFIPAGWRELVVIAAAVIAYFWILLAIHKRNGFTFAPIRELDWLFLGIFGTMAPMLDYMEPHAGDLGLHSDFHFLGSLVFSQACSTTRRPISHSLPARSALKEPASTQRQTSRNSRPSTLITSSRFR
jgi:hypothetical protein